MLMFSIMHELINRDIIIKIKVFSIRKILGEKIIKRWIKWLNQNIDGKIEN